MGYYRPWKPHFLKYFYLFLNYFWPCWVFVATWAFSSCGEQGRGSSLVVVRRLLIAVAFLLQGTWAQELWLPGSREPAQGLWRRTFYCSPVCGIFLDQGSNPRLLNWQADSPPLSHQGSSTLLFVNSPGCLCAKSLQSCPALCGPMDCSP